MRWIRQVWKIVKENRGGGFGNGDGDISVT